MNRNSPAWSRLDGRPTIFDHLGGYLTLPTSPRYPDNHTVSMSAGRLKKWQAQLESIEDVRNAIKSLSMSRSEKMKLFGLTSQMKYILGDVKEEMREKLRR
jgi:hypothetical protein